MLIVVLALCIVAQAGKPEKKDAAPAKTKHFNTKFAKSSLDLYDFFQNDSKSIFVVTFYLKGDGHEKKVEKLEASLQNNKKAMDKIIYIEVDSGDLYQYHGILYDLGIKNAPHQFPYFLIIYQRLDKFIIFLFLLN